MNIKFAKPSIGQEEIDAVVRVMENGWLTMGPVTQEFEEQFAKYVGAKYAVAVSSGTAALFLALKALKVDEKSRVFVPSLTFTASASVATHCGARPVFVDVDKETMLINNVQGHLKGSDAVVAVHLTGNAVYWDGKRVVHDCAHRIDRDMCKKKKGIFCYSFYPTKNMAGAEGGMIAFNDKKLLDFFRLARSHGQTKNGFERYKAGTSFEYRILFPGWKMNMTDIQAAILIEQLKKLPSMDVKRNHIIAKYNKAFGYDRFGLHLYPILVKNREKFLKKMRNLGVFCSVHFLPLHKMPAYPNVAFLPNTEWLGDRLVSLPLYPDLTDEEVDYIIDAVHKCGGVIHD